MPNDSEDPEPKRPAAEDSPKQAGPLGAEAASAIVRPGEIVTVTEVISAVEGMESAQAFDAREVATIPAPFPRRPRRTGNRASRPCPAGEAFAPEAATTPSELASAPVVTDDERRGVGIDPDSNGHPPSPNGVGVEPTRAELDAAALVAARMLQDRAFVNLVVDSLAERMGAAVANHVVARVAREVIDTAGDQLARAVAERIAETWQRAARTSSAAAGNGWTLRPRQRGNNPTRGRNPRA
jgi:hypothetical protein